MFAYVLFKVKQHGKSRRGQLSLTSVQSSLLSLDDLASLLITETWSFPTNFTMKPLNKLYMIGFLAPY